MKNSILVLLLLFVIDSFGQDNGLSRIGLYKWKETVLITPSDINGVSINKLPILTKTGQKFRVIKIINDANAVIKILDYTKKATENAQRTYEPTPEFYKYNFKGFQDDYNRLKDEEVNSRNYGDMQRYFTIGIAVIDELALKESFIGGGLAAGVINFPFKYRSQKKNQDFSGAFNFGAGIGYTFKHKAWRDYTHSVISGYSISNIVLDPSNVSSNQQKLETTNNFSAFSFSLGYLVQYQKVQAGIFLGWDRLNDINQKEFGWQYQGKPWISIGFGLTIFSSQEEREGKNQPESND